MKNLSRNPFTGGAVGSWGWGWPIDNVSWIDFFAGILNEAFRSPDHKTLFKLYSRMSIGLLTLPGRFGMARLKLGWMGETARQS